jgi:hypothetical protein
MDIDGKQSVFVSGKSELLSNGGITMGWTNFGENIWTKFGNGNKLMQKKTFFINKRGQSSAGPTGSGFDPTGPLSTSGGCICQKILRQSILFFISQFYAEQRKLMESLWTFVTKEAMTTTTTTTTTTRKASTRMIEKARWQIQKHLFSSIFILRLQDHLLYLKIGFRFFVKR